MQQDMRTGMSDEDLAWLPTYLLGIQAIVEKHGWAIQGCQPTHGQVGPTFAYTIGLIQRGCAAEVLVSGLPITLLQKILNQIAASMLNGNGMPPTSWELPGNGERTYTMKPVFVTRTEEPLVPLMAMRYYQRPGVPIIQYVWPSEDGSYPWDPQWPYDADAQPVGGTGRPLEQ
jgi:uncharacterized protein DUF4262